MNAQIILGSTVLATIFSTVISFIISRRQGSLQYITGERKEWREQIRNIAYNLNNASYGKTLKILIELKVRINGFGMNRKNCMEDAPSRETQSPQGQASDFPLQTVGQLSFS